MPTGNHVPTAVSYTHLLVQCVLALVVATHSGCFGTGTPYSVNLVDEHDTRRFFLCLAEDVYKRQHLMQMDYRVEDGRGISCSRAEGEEPVSYTHLMVPGPQL